MLITAASSSAEVRRYQNKILDTSGHQKYTVVVPIDSQVIISYISMFYSDFRSRWSICCVPSCQSQWTVILNNKKQRKKNNNATKYPKSCLHDVARTTSLFFKCLWLILLVICTFCFSLKWQLCCVSGENSIVIVAGANLLLSERDILSAETLIASSRVLICQLEICKSITFAALALARKHGGVCMLLCVKQLEHCHHVYCLWMK